MGFKSVLNLRLSSRPITNNSSEFDALNPIYTAVKLLNQAYDSIAGALIPSDSDAALDEQMPFIRIAYLTLAVPVVAGNIVTPFKGNGSTANGSGIYVAMDGLVLGAGSSPVDAGAAFTGIALESGIAGDKIKIGFGPAIINLAGVQTGQYVYGQRFRTGVVTTNQNLQYNGALSTTAPANPIIVGQGVASNYMLFDGSIRA